MRPGCARRLRLHPAAGRDARHAASFIDHDYRRGAKAHQVVRRRVEQDAYREAGRDPHPVEGTLDMREAPNVALTSDATPQPRLSTLPGTGRLGCAIT